MEQYNVQSSSRTEFINIDDLIDRYINKKNFTEGIIFIFSPHTTAGLTINENADPDVTADMEKILNRLVPWEKDYAHIEGNSAAHVKSSMMGSSVNVFVENKSIKLGTWQSVYFCEFDGPRSRKIWIKGVLL